ncbi:MAG: protein kinase [Planctomycetes bacterium]|nr:protein kinase [Planctomycetota bacterium]
MATKLSCLHGHPLDMPDKRPESARLVCPLCGADVRDSKDNDTELGALAITVVPTSQLDAGRSQLVPQVEGPEDGGVDKSNDHIDDAEVADGSYAQTTFLDPSRIAVAGDAATHRDETQNEEGTGNDAPQRQPASPAKQDLQPPALPGLEVIEEIGRGGMGVVYRAYDEKHGREVALKTLQRMGPDDLIRFKQEFRALADIAHSNLASLYELHSDGTTWCLTMELLHGVEFLEYVWSEFESLRIDGGRRRVADVAGQSRLTVRRINRLYDGLKQLAIGLNELHRHGKLHSDIKPSNVLVTTEGRVVLVDFGLVAEITRDEDGRLPRMIQGTPHYMAPEQVACSALTAASDWYAVGVMLYEVLTGRLPFNDKSVKAMLRKRIEAPLAPNKRKPGVPKELSDLCMAMLEIDASNRPSTIDVLRAVEADDVANSILEASTSTVVQSVDLVGRESHLKVLNQSLRAVTGGETCSVFVHGLSGMGKSVLIRSFVDSIQSSSTSILLEGRCYEQESVPFKALDSLVDALVGYLCGLHVLTLEKLMPEDMLPLVRLFPVFGQVSGASNPGRPTIDNADQQELRKRGFTSLRALLTSLGKRAPVVFYIDDMQWGDEDSAHLLADLVRPPDSPRLLVLGSYRREDVGRSPALIALEDAYQKGTDHPHRQELPVDPLSESDASRLALQLLGGDAVQQQVAERIAGESGGSPFFVWELAQHVQDESTASFGSLELDEVIWSRVCRLPAETRSLLEVFAVAGRPMRASEAYETIDARTHGPGLLAQLRTSNFIRTTEGDEATVVETYHDRIRESVVNHLPAARVRAHHLKIALVIEQSGDVNLSTVQSHINKTPEFEGPGDPLELITGVWQRVFDLSYFFDAAGKSERALPYALVAAERAWSQNALEVAEQQFEIARRGAEVSNDAMRFRIAEGLGDVLLLRARYDRAHQHFKTARSLATSNQVLARIDSKLGYLCFKSGDMEESAAHLEKTLTELGSPPPSNIAVQTLAVVKELLVQLLHTWLPSVFTKRRNPDTASGRRELFSASIYQLLSYPYWWKKGPVPNLWAHLRHMNLSERYPPSQVLGRAWSFHAVIMTAVPLTSRGIAYAERSFGIHLDDGDLQGQGKARSYQTFAFLTAGRFNEGVEAGREAVRLLEEAGDVWEANMARIILSFPLYYQGNLESAAANARKAIQIGKETGDASSVMIALWFWVLYAPEQVPDGLITAELQKSPGDPLSDTSIILARGLELLLREDNPREAANVLLDALNVAKKRGLRNPCVFCGLAWRAETLRIVAEREPAGRARNAVMKQARRAVRHALITTRLYLTSRPHALRENANLHTLADNETRARQAFDASLQLARQQEAKYEVARTELARAEAGLKFGWSDAEAQLESAKQEISRITGFVLSGTMQESHQRPDQTSLSNDSRDRGANV